MRSNYIRFVEIKEGKFKGSVNKSDFKYHSSSGSVTTLASFHSNSKTFELYIGIWATNTEKDNYL